MPRNLLAFYEQPWFIIVMLLAIFGAIVLAVILIKKYAPAFKTDDKPKSDKEIAEEEVNRLVRPVEDDEAARQMEASAKDLESKTKTPSPEKKDDTMERVTRPIENEEAAKQMEEYAKAHPEEAEALDQDEKKEEK